MFDSSYPNFLRNAVPIKSILAIRPIAPPLRQNMLNGLFMLNIWDNFSLLKHERFLLASKVRTIQILGDESTCEGSNGFVSVVHLPYTKTRWR